MFKSQFIFVFVVLQLSVLSSVLVTLTSGSPDRGWWPFYVIVFGMVSLLYAIVFSAIAHWKNISVFPAGYVHILIALITVLLTILFYHLDTDWLSINNGAQMTLVQRIVHADITGYMVYALGFIVAILVGVTARHVERS